MTIYTHDIDTGEVNRSKMIMHEMESKETTGKDILILCGTAG